MSTFTAVAALAVWVVTELLKTKAGKQAFHKVPKRWRAMVPVVLGMAAAGVQHFALSGGDWHAAANTALVAGGLPVFFHEVAVKGVLGRKSASGA